MTTRMRKKKPLLQVYRQKTFERYKGTYRIIHKRNGKELLQYPLCSPIEYLCRSTRHTREVFRTIHSKANDMSTRMTINGVSTCQTAGTEKYESFQLGYGRKRRTLVQYDYRHHTDGELFSCVKPTLEECRNERDKWLNKKQGKEDKL